MPKDLGMTESPPSLGEPSDLGLPGEAPPGAPPLDMPSAAPPEMGATPPGDMGAAPPMEPTSAMAPEQPPGFRPAAPEMPSMGAQAPAADKDMQLINAKLDAIKAGIDSLHQRMDKMELEKQKEEKAYAWK